MTGAGPTIQFPDLDIVGVGAILAAIAIIWGVIKVVNSTMRFINQFKDDWQGTKGDKNHPPTDGVLAQMIEMRASLVSGEETRKAMGVILEKLVDDVALVKDQMNHELTHNNGSTLKDAAHEAKRDSKEALVISKDLQRIVGEIQFQQEQEIIESRKWRTKMEKEHKEDRRERKATYLAVETMIGKTPEEQSEVWDKVLEPYQDTPIEGPPIP